MRAASRLLRLTALVAAVGALVGMLWWASQGTLASVTRPGTATVDELLALAAATAGWCIVGWLTLATLLTALVGVLGRSSGVLAAAAAALTPALLRRLVSGALGVAIVAGPTAVAAPAWADTGSGTSATATAAATRAASDPLLSLDRPAAAAAQHVSSGIEQGPAVAESDGTVAADDLPDSWTPDRPAPGPSAPRPSAPVHLVVSAPTGERADAKDVVVRRGDTLWGIAARALGPDATDAEIAAEWPRWYDANRRVIGADPDLLKPGQVLRPPPPP